MSTEDGPTPQPPKSTPPPSAPAPVREESHVESIRRHAQRTKLYLWAGGAAALLVVVVALVIANTRQVEVSWVFGSTRQSLVWIIVATALLGWLLGIATSIIFRFRTRREKK